MHIRTYQPCDEAQWVAMWNKVLWADKTSTPIFRERILMDPNFDPEGCVVAENDNTIVGGVVGLIRRTDLPWGFDGQKDKDQQNGFIIAFLIPPEYVETAVPKGLLSRVVSFFQSANKQRILLGGYRPGFFPAGIPRKDYPHLFSVLKDNGFVEEHTCDSMARDLNGFRTPKEIEQTKASLEKEEISVSAFHPQHLLAVRGFLQSEFPHWLHNFEKKLSQQAPFDEIVIAIKSQEDIVGYCQHDYLGHPGRIGPFGVSQSFRGRKIGTVMLCNLLERMSEKGYRHAWFGETETELVKSYYERMGFKAVRKITRLVKEITSDT